MEELLAFLGFTVGAAATLGAARTLRRGLRSAAVQTIRVGLATGDAASRVRAGFSHMIEEARHEKRSKPRSRAR